MPRARYTSDFIDRFDLTPFERCVAVLLILLARDPSGEGEAWATGGENVVRDFAAVLGVPESRVRNALIALEIRHHMLERCTWEDGRVDYVISGYRWEGP